MYCISSNQNSQTYLKHTTKITLKLHRFHHICMDHFFNEMFMVSNEKTPFFCTFIFEAKRQNSNTARERDMHPRRRHGSKRIVEDEYYYD